MGIRFAALLTCLAVLSALPRAAHAEWHKRTDTVMGTRIYVELWDTDAAHGEASIDAVMAEMRRIDDLMSHYKPESQLSQINQHAADAPVVSRQRAVRSHQALDPLFRDYRRCFRHHLRKCRLSLQLSRTTSARPRSRSKRRCRR